MFNIKAVILDFDGTLADTLPICYFSFQNVFKAFDGKDLNSEEIKAMFGPSETEIIRKNLSNGNKEQAIELFYEKYSEHHSQLVKQNDEMDNLLKYLKDKGMKLGIVTGKARRSLDISLEALQMNGLFDVIITGDDVITPKPHPEGIFKALANLDVEKDHAIFLGDSEADIRAGVEADVFTAGVQWLPEYQSAEFSTKPDALFKQIKEFIDFIKAEVSKSDKNTATYIKRRTQDDGG